LIFGVISELWPRIHTHDAINKEWTESTNYSQCPAVMPSPQKKKEKAPGQQKVP